MRSLLDNLLTVSQMETVAQKLEIQVIDFRKLIRHSVESFMAEAKSKGVELSFQFIRGEALQLQIDAAKFNWAISNLITNALRHTPRGGSVTVEVRSKQEFVLVQVRDTGPGIERSRHDSIFEKFSPYYDLRVARSGGAGAGLAIAKEIVSAHGGRIWVTSSPGSGSEFSFTIPFNNMHLKGVPIVTYSGCG